MKTEQLYNLFLQSSGINTDSRQIKSGNIFFALKGENFNGNQFAEKALADGALYSVIDEKEFYKGENFILVKNVLKILQELAAFHRKEFNIPVLAICGSNGKTTTKELIKAVLETKYKIHATEGNLNNHIGVPLTLLKMKKETELAVIEIGANHIGETAELCETIAPNFGIITNNGKDHLEGFGSIEEVKKANGELYDYLKKNNGTVFVSNLQDDLMLMSNGIKQITFGKSSADCNGKIIEANPFFKLETLNSKLQTKLIGHYNFENIMAAICIGSYFKVSSEKIKSAIENYQPQNNRSQLLKKDSNTFILDAYNANPSSMKAAIDSFIQIQAKNKIAILGDMLELGKESFKEHTAIVELLKTSNLNKIILVGEEFKKAKDNLSCIHFDSVEKLKKWFYSQKFSDTYFLLKASRKIQLEKLLA